MTIIVKMAKKIKKKVIRAPDFLNNPTQYNKSFSRGIRLNLNKATFLFISGTASIDRNGKTLYPGKILLQAKRTFDNITALLKSEKANWQDIVMTRCYIRDMRNYERFNIVRNRFYRDKKIAPFPASVCVQAALCRPDLEIEIEAIAVL